MMLPLTGLPPDSSVLPPLPTAATKDKRRLTAKPTQLLVLLLLTAHTHPLLLPLLLPLLSHPVVSLSTDSSHDASYDASHHSRRQFAQGAAYNMSAGDSEDHHDNGHHQHRRHSLQRPEEDNCHEDEGDQTDGEEQQHDDGNHLPSSYHDDDSDHDDDDDDQHLPKTQQRLVPPKLCAPTETRRQTGYEESRDFQPLVLQPMKQKKRWKMAKKNEKSASFQSPLVADAIENTKLKGQKTKKKTKDREKQKKKRKRSQKDLDDEAEEKRLTALLFGGDASMDMTRNDTQDQEEEEGEKTEQVSRKQSFPLFELDRDGDGENENPEESVVGQRFDDDQDDDEEGESKQSAAAWVDDDDANLSVDIMKTLRFRKLRTHRSENVSSVDGSELEKRLRRRFETTTMTSSRTDWASIASKTPTTTTRPQTEQGDGDNDDDGLLVSSSSAEPLLLSSSSLHRRLPPQILQVHRCRDANQKDPNDAVVRSVHFHPSSDPDRPLLLTAGLDKTLRFFHVGEDESDKVHGIHFPKLPIYCAAFVGDTGKVVVSGRRRFFYVYDSIAGKLDMVPRIMGREEKSLERFTASPDGRTIAFLGNDGYIILVDVKTKHWIADLKMNGSVRAVTFTPDSQFLLSSGSDGDVYRWDLRTRRCVERFSNEDGTITSTLAVSKRVLAVGAESGVVNLYPSAAQPRGSPRKPLKSVLSLHTSNDASRFNHDGQILALSTQREKHGLKLLHVPTQTVFSNWPTSKTPLGYVWSTDFSPQSKFLAVGNDRGKCLLYKLNHYHV